MIRKENAIEKANEKRKEWAKSDALRDAGIKEPGNVKKITDITYTESETQEEMRCHLMDIYYPCLEEAFHKNKAGCIENRKYPVIVSVHGGGWFYGDKELYRLYTMALATYGFAVVNFNYRLSPEYPYPAGFMDVCAVMDYLKKHGEEYGLDMERVYMVGDSAGAQLVSQYCIYATCQGYRELFSFHRDMQLVVPKKVALNCGIYDVGSMVMEDEACDWYLPFQMTKKEALSFFRILDYMTKDFPATYLMLSVNDALSKYTVPMKKRLEELDIPLVYREFGQNEPADGHVFHLNLRSENGRLANREEMEFFETNIL